jgi:hypothetical protein
MHELGVGWLRMSCDWKDIQVTSDPNPATWNWSCPDNVILGAANEGFRVLFNLAGTPGWANGGNDGTHPPLNTSTYYTFCYNMMARYAGYGVAWEIWNEPNLTKFFAGTLQQYVDLAQTARSALNAAGDSTARLAGPNTSDADTQWFAYAMSALPNTFDIVSVHYYPDTGLDNYLNWIAGYRNGRPVWLTETGNNSPDDNGQYWYYSAVLNSYAKRSEHPYWENVFFYRLFDDVPWDPDYPKRLVNIDRSNRPAFYFYQSWIAYHPDRY